MTQYGVCAAEHLGDADIRDYWWVCEHPERPVDDLAWLHVCIEDPDPDRPGQSTGIPRPCPGCAIAAEAILARGDSEHLVGVARHVMGCQGVKPTIDFDFNPPPLYVIDYEGGPPIDGLPGIR